MASDNDRRATLNRLLDQPEDVFRMVISNFNQSEVKDLKNLVPEYVKKLSDLDRSQWAIDNNEYECYSCVKMLPEWHFDTQQAEKRRGSSSRFCIRCGLEPLYDDTQHRGENRRERPGSQTVSRYSKGDEIRTEGPQRFVLCYKCGLPGKCGGKVGGRKGVRHLVCESCAHQKQPQTLEELLNEMWEAQRNAANRD